MIDKRIQKILENASIAVNGKNPWDIRVNDERFYSRVWHENSLGLGESYMDGWWDCEQLDEFINRLLRYSIQSKVKGNLRYLFRFVPGILFNLQSKKRAAMIAERHYDLDNDLFFSFLDSYKQYSCGYFEETNDLDRAQQNKLALIDGKLNLTSHDHVLDIGCGWGGFARYAAERYGCQITAVNISQEQLRYAREYCKGLNVNFQNCDYRSITGLFDKILSVGMFEHVGWKNYRSFMKIVYKSLKDDGIFLLHTIGSNTSGRGRGDPWIEKYIFPNSSLPSMAQIAKAAEGFFIIEDVQNLAPHYEKTLLAWNDRFQKNWNRLKVKYEPNFKRMWEYYLLSCAGAFRARTIQIWQIVMTKHGSGTLQPSMPRLVESPCIQRRNEQSPQ